MEAFIDNIEADKLNGVSIYEAFARHIERASLFNINDKSYQKLYSKLEDAILNIERKIQDLKDSENTKDQDSVSSIESLLFLWLLIIKDDLNHIKVIKMTIIKLEDLYRYPNSELIPWSKKRKDIFLKKFYPNYLDIHAYSRTVLKEKIFKFFEKPSLEEPEGRLNTQIKHIAFEMFMDKRRIAKKNLDFFESENDKEKLEELKLEELFLQMFEKIDLITVEIKDINAKIIKRKRILESKINN